LYDTLGTEVSTHPNANLTYCTVCEMRMQRRALCGGSRDHIYALEAEGVNFDVYTNWQRRSSFSVFCSFGQMRTATVDRDDARRIERIPES
jgi:hypothetical protein